MHKVRGLTNFCFVNVVLTGRQFREAVLFNVDLLQSSFAFFSSWVRADKTETLRGYKLMHDFFVTNLAKGRARNSIASSLSKAGLCIHIDYITDSPRTCKQSRVQNPARSHEYMYSFMIGLFLHAF